jgi:hypothetical protein
LSFIIIVVWEAVVKEWMETEEVNNYVLESGDESTLPLVLSSDQSKPVTFKRYLRLVKSGKFTFLE